MAATPQSKSEMEMVRSLCARDKRSKRQRRLVVKFFGLAVVPLLAMGFIGFGGPLFDRAIASSDDPAGNLVQQGRGNGFGRGFRGGRGSGVPQAEPRAGAGTVSPEALPGLTQPTTPIESPPAPPVLSSDDQASPPTETPQQRFEKDRELFHALLSRHEEIRREVELLEDGVRTLTEADDPELSALIKQHVKRMKSRVEEPAPIHMRDPLFRALFQNYESITMTVEETEHGVRVTETSDDPFAVKLIQAHAAVVNLFVKNGHSEVRLNHDVPARD